MGPALTRAVNTLGHVITPAAPVITITITGPTGAITMAVVTRTTALTRAIRTRTGVTAYPGGITRTRITAGYPSKGSKNNNPIFAGCFLPAGYKKTHSS